MTDSKELAEKLFDGVFKTLKNHFDTVIKAQDLSGDKAEEMKEKNDAILMSQINKSIDDLIAKGLSEEDASKIVEDAYMKILDELD